MVPHQRPRRRDPVCRQRCCSSYPLHFCSFCLSIPLGEGLDSPGVCRREVDTRRRQNLRACRCRGFSRLQQNSFYRSPDARSKWRCESPRLIRPPHLNISGQSCVLAYSLAAIVAKGLLKLGLLLHDV